MYIVQYVLGMCLFNIHTLLKHRCPIKIDLEMPTRLSSISFKNMYFWCPILDSHLTTYCSYIGDRLKSLTELSPHAFVASVPCHNVALSRQSFHPPPPNICVVKLCKLTNHTILPNRALPIFPSSLPLLLSSHFGNLLIQLVMPVA